ncbi:CTSE, partial [Symbiodinium sp. KB8]
MPSSLVDPVSWDIAADLPMGRFLTLTFLLTFLGTNVISWNIALLVSTGVTVVTAGLTIAVEGLHWEPQTAGYALHVASFQLFLCIFLVSACIQKPMRYLTTWCVLLHIIYFGTFDISNPKLDSFVSWSHPASFVAACFVYIGFFLVSNFYGGGAPKDMIPAIAECPVLHSFCIGWNHISPVLCHLIDGYLNGSNFHRIYGQGGVLWLLVVGVGIFYTVGQVYEWLMPNSVETYLAPKVWYLRSRRLAQRLGLRDLAALRNRKATIFCLGEDFAFSLAVKVPEAKLGRPVADFAKSLRKNIVSEVDRLAVLAVWIFWCWEVHGRPGKDQLCQAFNLLPASGFDDGVSLLSVVLQNRSKKVQLPPTEGTEGAGPILIPLTRLRGNATGASWRNSSYVGELFLGRPQLQRLTVTFDTASGQVILPSSRCRSLACLEHQRYAPRASTSSREINADGSQVRVPAGARTIRRDAITVGVTSIDHGSGRAYGDLIYDRLCFGGVARKAQCASLGFVGVTNMSDAPFRDMLQDGLVGLGLAQLAANPIFHVLSRLDLPSGMARRFGVFLQADGGELSIGGLNPTRLQGGDPTQLNWAPVHQPE